MEFPLADRTGRRARDRDRDAESFDGRPEMDQVHGIWLGGEWIFLTAGSTRPEPGHELSSKNEFQKVYFHCFWGGRIVKHQLSLIGRFLISWRQNFSPRLSTTTKLSSVISVNDFGANTPSLSLRGRGKYSALPRFPCRVAKTKEWQSAGRSFRGPPVWKPPWGFLLVLIESIRQPIVSAPKTSGSTPSETRSRGKFHAPLRRVEPAVEKSIPRPAKSRELDPFQVVRQNFPRRDLDHVPFLQSDPPTEIPYAA